MIAKVANPPSPGDFTGPGLDVLQTACSGLDADRRNVLASLRRVAVATDRAASILEAKPSTATSLAATRPPERVEAPVVLLPVRSRRLKIRHAGLSAALAFLRQNYLRAIRLRHVARASGLSVRGLNHLFRVHLGESPAACIRRMRLAQAKHRLVVSRDSIKQVAAMSGYLNTNSLNAAFRKATGLSPSEFRARAAGPVAAAPHPAVIRGGKYLNTHFRQPITVTDIVRASGLSRQGFHANFVKDRGETPGAALRRLRLHHARRLLETCQSMTMQDVALNSGFSNHFSFYSAFLQFWGVPPHRYQQQARQGHLCSYPAPIPDSPITT